MCVLLSLIHISTPVLLKFAEEYAQAYEKGTALYGVPAAELFEEYRLFLVPLVNPDGVDLVNGLLTDGEMCIRDRTMTEKQMCFVLS